MLELKIIKNDLFNILKLYWQHVSISIYLRKINEKIILLKI